MEGGDENVRLLGALALQWLQRRGHETLELVSRRSRLRVKEGDLVGIPEKVK